MSAGQNLHRSPPRPLVVFALAAAMGMSLDAALSPPVAIWVACSSILLIAWFLRDRRGRAREGAWLIALAVATTSAAYHRFRDPSVASDPLAKVAATGQAVVTLRGTVASEPIVRWPELDRTAVARPRPAPWAVEPTARFDLAVDQIRESGKWARVHSRVRVNDRGDDPRLERGQRIELVGVLNAPSPPLNPGEFDYGAYLRSQGIATTLWTEDKAALTILAPAPAWSPRRFVDAIRSGIGALLEGPLPTAEAGLARALLVGDRAGLTPSQITPYFEGGAIHLLVVSGMQVGVVALLVWRMANLAPLRLAPRALISIAIVSAYAIVAGADPPVTRAAIVIALWLGGFALGRSAEPINSLAAAALVIMLINPNDLFRPGPQLSFLCVFAAIVFVPPLLERYNEWRGREQAMLLGRRPTGFAAVMDVVARWTLVSAVLWLATAPLVAYHFHLFAPVSLLVSVVMAPLMAVVLSLIVTVVIAAAVAPALAWLPAIPCIFLLRFMDNLVANTSQFPGAFVYLPSPPMWWILVFYAGLVIPWAIPVRQAMGRRCALAVCAWLILGALAPCVRANPSAVEYHQLAVGHGSCAAMRFPDGRTILYDCGSLRGVDIAERVVAPWLWSQGISRVDGVFLSHPDVDHFNGLESLSRRFPIGQVFITPAMARARQPRAEALLDYLVSRNVPVTLVWAEDVLRVGDATFRVVAPPASAPYRDDNANSMVVELRVAGRKVLLTGDLDGDGLNAMLQRAEGPVDVLIAPHHGGKQSNPVRLVEWASPSVVVSTQGRRRGDDDPLAEYAKRGAHVFRTDRDGALSLRIAPDGIAVRAARDGWVDLSGSRTAAPRAGDSKW